jgi:nitroreductase
MTTEQPEEVAAATSPLRRPAPVTRPVLDVIAERWSPRALDPNRPVERETVFRLLEAARWAPSSRNEQPWRYVVYDSTDPDALARARSCLNDNNYWALNAAVLNSPLRG